MQDPQVFQKNQNVNQKWQGGQGQPDPLMLYPMKISGDLILTILSLNNLKRKLQRIYTISITAKPDDLSLTNEISLTLRNVL